MNQLNIFQLALNILDTSCLPFSHKENSVVLFSDQLLAERILGDFKLPNNIRDWRDSELPYRIF